MPSPSRRTFLSHAVLARAVLGSSSLTLASQPWAQESVQASSTPTDWKNVANIARTFDQCRAMLIYQDSQPVFSEVFRGPAINKLVPIKSVSKTVVAALAGIAIDRSEIPSVKATLGELVPKLIPSKADPKVGDITIENLLTMQAGLERTSGPNYGVWVNSRNWVADALSRPMVREPGNGMLYSTGTSHVMGAVLSTLSGKSLLSLTRERIGKPLGIEIPAWTRDPQGRYLGGNEMALTLTGMIRFGELYLHGGRFNNKQVLSEQWTTQSLVPVTTSVFSGLGYGYGWFIGQSGGTNYALARGYGGQIIGIVPELKLSFAITSDPTRLARSGGYFGDLQRLIENNIIPMAR